ncbi:zinc finger protein 333-like, partial [Penaeus japonicus]|uniref:zinc finger protein 333-like n=1 Tax=Penaeus japonicus TaxID=27405 RepID=UPI001C7176CE
RQTSLCRSHQRTHTGEKPYTCPYCDAAHFRDTVGLKAHLRTHAGEKPFACRVCRASFVNLTTFTTHCRMHSMNGQTTFKSLFGSQINRFHRSTFLAKKAFRDVDRKYDFLPPSFHLIPKHAHWRRQKKTEDLQNGNKRPKPSDAHKMKLYMLGCITTIIATSITALSK